MADSDSEIEFNREHENREREDDRHGTDTEEQDQNDQTNNRAASVLSSVVDLPPLEEIPAQQPRTRHSLEGEYLGIPIDTHARGDISGNASAPVLHSPPMKPKTYDGDEDWESYLSHFEICAKLGRWSYQDKALYLAACLRGNAQVYYMTLKLAERTSYGLLTTKLGQRFGNNRQQPMWISKLEARMRKPNESIAQLGDDLRRLAQRAYSNMNHEAREMLALNQLYKSVTPELKYKCISDNCASVTKAVSIIETFEGILGAENEKKKQVRHVATEGDETQESMGTSFGRNLVNDNLQGMLRQLQNCIGKLTQQCNNQARGNQYNYQARGNQGPPGGARDRDGQRLCYICLSPRHLKRDCPNNERNRRDQRPYNRQRQQPNMEAQEHQQGNHRPSTQ
ncbi:MAG: hypothetical protein N0E59_22705 [Candidatus Thiodiazotropha taylori]|nr:hypothetical protein [Candidatus Thiodiazotropha taylori]MCW4285931.1 hypothetical protein [Candidatus Thiodiazotropha taylori]